MNAPDSPSTTLWKKVIDSIAFNDQGLVPAIAQQFDSREVLMQAWMNRDSLLQTLRQGEVCYWSRSRHQLWRKGETSGHTQKLVEIRWDCDRDCILLLVDQKGPACHTGQPSCFFHSLKNPG